MTASLAAHPGTSPESAHAWSRAPGEIYEGTIRHRRFEPREHAFTYRLFMLYLDCDRMERLLRTTRFAAAGDQRWPPALVRYDRRDYFGDPSIPLGEAVRDTVQAHTGRRPVGRVSMLTHLRTLGLAFNPVSFYYCFAPPAADGFEALEHVVAEITNTPWDERHCYVLSEPVRVATSGARTFHLAKQFHVSPFHPMDHRYRWTFGEPGETLLVHMENHRREATQPDATETTSRAFDATLTLRRRGPLTSRSLLSSQIRFPAMTARVMGWIYLQAARLWMKRVPFYDHPRHRATDSRGSAPERDQMTHRL